MSGSDPIRLELVLTGERFDALAAAVAERLAASRRPADDDSLNTAQAADYLACTPDRLHDLVARTSTRAWARRSAAAVQALRP